MRNTSSSDQADLTLLAILFLFLLLYSSSGNDTGAEKEAEQRHTSTAVTAFIHKAEAPAAAYMLRIASTSKVI
jgi:hypothetical protein